MKICLISNLYNPYILGGAEIYAEKIANYLSKENKVIVITTKPYEGLNSLKPSVEIRDNIKIYRFYPLNIYYLYNAPNIKIPDFLKLPWHIIDQWNIHSYFTIKKILEKEKPDVVHTHNLGGLSISAFNAVKSLNLPLIHTCHDYHIICPYATLLCPFWRGELCKYPKVPCEIYRKVKRKIIHGPDIVTAPSQFVLDAHSKAGFFKESKKIAPPLGIEIENINFNKKEKDNKEVNILYVGQLGKHKGIQILISAFKQINKNAKLHIVGDGHDKEYFKDLASNDKRIIFYGKIPNEETQKFYKNADITVVPSIWYETFGIVVIESFKFGTPVVASRIGNYPELVKDGYNGFLFEQGNIDELKKILENIIENPKQLEELSRNAFESVKKYSMDKHIEKLIEIYKQAIELNK